MARACGACFSSVQAVFLVSGLVFAFICSASGASRPPPPPPTGGYAGFREQMYLNNGNTGQCECCYPDWASSTPNQTFMVPFLNSTSMPDWWSDNVNKLLMGAIQHPRQTMPLHGLAVLPFQLGTTILHLNTIVALQEVHSF
ncbi:hypothetical protein WJX77_010440 [Trebouxia sp. C0004]